MVKVADISLLHLALFGVDGLIFINFINLIHLIDLVAFIILF